MADKKSDVNGIVRELKTHALILGGCTALLWGILALNFVLQGTLFQFGIIPRTMIGLRGILFAPFLHANFLHLAANTVPFLTLGWFVMLRGVEKFFEVTLIVMLVGGLGTWLTAAPNTVHIGASGVIFGYLGFLVLRGYFEHSFLAIFFSIFAVVFYGGLLWGVLPGQPYISWQGHLFGFMGGAIAARLLAVDREGPDSL